MYISRIDAVCDLLLGSRINKKCGLLWKKKKIARTLTINLFWVFRLVQVWVELGNPSRCRLCLCELSTSFWVMKARVLGAHAWCFGADLILWTRHELEKQTEKAYHKKRGYTSTLQLWPGHTVSSGFLTINKGINTEVIKIFNEVDIRVQIAAQNMLLGEKNTRSPTWPASTGRQQIYNMRFQSFLEAKVS